MTDIVDRANHAVRLSKAARLLWEQDHALRVLANVVPELVAEIKNLRDEIESLRPQPCKMTHTEPFDFAQCETHDTTFALGDVCKFHERDPWEVVTSETMEQRGRAVRAEVEADQLRDEVEWFRAEFPDHGYQGGTDDG